MADFLMAAFVPRQQLTSKSFTTSAGKSAWGIELSEAVLKSECPDLLKKKVRRRLKQCGRVPVLDGMTMACRLPPPAASCTDGCSALRRSSRLGF